MQKKASKWGGGDGVWLRAAAAVDDEGVSNGDDDKTKVMKDVMGMKMVVDMGCFGVGDGCGPRPESWLDKNGGAGICYSGREGRDGNESVGELHNLLDKVVSVGTAPGPNNSDHNVNTITNGDGMPRMRTFRETIFPE
ncbi:hypothetical protein Tco_0319930 [Tanacetum coccineum]